MPLLTHEGLFLWTQFALIDIPFVLLVATQLNWQLTPWHCLYCQPQIRLFSPATATSPLIIIAYHHIPQIIQFTHTCRSFPVSLWQLCLYTGCLVHSTVMSAKASGVDTICLTKQGYDTNTAINHLASNALNAPFHLTILQDWKLHWLGVTKLVFPLRILLPFLALEWNKTHI